MKITKKKTTLGGIALGLTALSLTAVAAPAFAHGASQTPMSRQLGCKLDGAGTWAGAKTYETCNEAAAISGEAPFSNWQGVVQGDTRLGEKDPQWQTVFPDGQLCSGGNDSYAGLDVAGKDWPTTTLKGGAETELTFHNTVNHNPYTFSYFVTKDGYDASKPLTWADLEETPFLVADSLESLGTNLDQGTKLPTVLPDKKGHHVIYTIWQGNIKADGAVQSNEAFVGCSDVDFE
ncbi:hypothetical protein AX769_09965 [Frondihabitans sp. PAMC 28766]|uniref:lytic polysaccharide monooxygenase auxiliary activity family 9 protein n=1 Tax=Frondihabitans sp. PAMC 28766 TaxID=1795630 RepID=UPI00078B6FBA|nr:lytic polysaccharide monooxygenase [Frondihabitans sp. PAMC 28766]AMM20416.1 hypothetical protein AX769_09965 [Frondihabitans sp. PAMC 28766]